MPKISALPAATAGNLTGAAILPTTDKNTLTVGPTWAQLRTAIFAGGTGYTATDPLTVGAITTSGGLQMTAAPILKLDLRNTDWDNVGHVGSSIQLYATATSGNTTFNAIEFSTNQIKEGGSTKKIEENGAVPGTLQEKSNHIAKCNSI